MDDTLSDAARRVEVARALLAADRPLGRLYLAGVHVGPAAELAYHQGLAPSVATERRIAIVREEIALAEAEQRAHGFGTGAEELLAAAAVVEPETVDRGPDEGHGSAIAWASQSSPRSAPGWCLAPWFDARAERRSDRRWRGAWAWATILARGAAMTVGARLDTPTAHDDAVAFVGRWARVGRLAVRVVPGC